MLAAVAVCSVESKPCFAKDARAILAPADIDRADAAFISGLKAYQGGSFALAVEQFQKALAITQSRVLLYNIARCYEKLGNRSAASDWYRAYLKTDPVDTTTVEARLNSLVPKGETDAVAGQTVIRKPEQLESIAYRWTKWGLMGLSGASLISAVGFGTQAIGAAQKSRAATDGIGAQHWRKQGEYLGRMSDYFAVFGLIAGGISTYLIV